MNPAGDKLKKYLEKVAIEAPQIALVNNVDVEIQSDPARIRDALVRQASAPVRWVEVIQRMAEAGGTHIVECGPGKVLSGLPKRIDPKIQSLSSTDRASLEQALQAVRGG